MRVFGIDCGTECTGYGVVDLDQSSREPHLTPVAFGGIRLKKKDSLAERLSAVHAELSGLIAQHRPDVVAVEEVFHSVNAQSALKLGHVRGVALLAAAGHAVPVVEYAPLKIKSSVVGFGLAKKEQVQYMVARLLHLAEPPEPADAADALALAICHLHHAETARNVSAGVASRSEPPRASRGRAVLLAAAFATLCLPPAMAQTQPARLSFDFENEALTPAAWHIDVDSAGTGHYHSRPGEAAAPDAHGAAPQAFDQEIRINSPLRDELFSIARTLKLFNYPCENAKHQVAFTGKKTAAYAGPEGQGSCTYNWSPDARIQKLTSSFLSISTTLEAGRRIRLDYLHDRLSLDADLETLTAEAKNGEAIEFENIAPELKAIVSDPAIMKRVQARAQALLAASPESATRSR